MCSLYFVVFYKEVVLLIVFFSNHINTFWLLTLKIFLEHCVQALYCYWCASFVYSLFPCISPKNLRLFLTSCPARSGRGPEGLNTALGSVSANRLFDRKPAWPLEEEFSAWPCQLCVLVGVSSPGCHKRWSLTKTNKKKKCVWDVRFCLRILITVFLDFYFFLFFLNADYKVLLKVQKGRTKARRWDERVQDKSTWWPSQDNVQENLCFWHSSTLKLIIMRFSSLRTSTRVHKE